VLFERQQIVTDHRGADQLDVDDRAGSVFSAVALRLDPLDVAGSRHRRGGGGDYCSRPGARLGATVVGGRLTCLGFGFAVGYILDIRRCCHLECHFIAGERYEPG